jgi:hypothetical protein
MVASFDMWMESENLAIMIDSYDRDSSLSSRSIGVSVVDGDLSVLQSSISTGQDSYELSVNLSLIFSQYVNSLNYSITSDTETLHLPLTMLTTISGSTVQITGASLDNSLIRTGLLFSERISGEFTVVGYELISEAQIGFKHTSGLWFNFTVNGAGIYEFVIAPSGFPMGEYQVYAIAKGQNVPLTEMQFATLTIIEDNTLIIVSAGVIVAALVVIFAFRRFRERRGIEE